MSSTYVGMSMMQKKKGTAILGNRFNSMIMIKSGMFSHVYPPIVPQKCLDLTFLVFFNSLSFADGNG